MLVMVVGHLVEWGGIGSLASSESESESLLGGPGGLEVTGISFLGSFRPLEIPSSEEGFSSPVCFSRLPLFKVLGALSSSKAVCLPRLVIVEIGGMSFCSSLNLCTLLCQGAGSSETEAFCPAKLDQV
jgi:hypothetical protein